MFEFLTTNPAVALLNEDHGRVKELFDRFEGARTRPAKLKIVRAALVELKVHAAIEEELFYPAVRKPVGKEIMNEADEEHHVAKLLIAEFDAMDGSESHFDAKFKVLAENVRHHIEQEEGEMLPRAQKVKLDFVALAEKMTGEAARGRRTAGRRGGDGQGLPGQGRLARPGGEAESPEAPETTVLKGWPRRRASESAKPRRHDGRRVNDGETGSRVGVAYPASGYRCLACRSRRVQYRAANRRVAEWFGAEHWQSTGVLSARGRLVLSASRSPADLWMEPCADRDRPASLYVR